jgi:hypothetical protein
VLGARPLRRTIQRQIEDQLSEKILFGEIEGGQIVIVDVEGVTPDAPEGSRSADDKARFTFRGEPKPVLSVPDRSGRVGERGSRASRRLLAWPTDAAVTGDLDARPHPHGHLRASSPGGSAKPYRFGQRGDRLGVQG